jgi:hypothetical protein
MNTSSMKSSSLLSAIALVGVASSMGSTSKRGGYSWAKTISTAERNIRKKKMKAQKKARKLNRK